MFWATTLTSTLPLCSTRYLPFTDFPEHTAAMATIARLMPGGGGAPYEIAFEKSQYLLFHAIGAVLTRLLGDAVLANRALLVVVAALWPLSARAMLRAFGRDERLAVFAGMVFWNRATAVGLEPYVASVPLLVYATAAMTRQLERPTARRAAMLVVLTLALFYSHASSFLLFAVIACGLIGVSVSRSWGDAVGRAAAVRTGLRTAATLVPSAVTALVWARVGGLRTAGPGAIERMQLVDSIAAMPIWTFDVWGSHEDELCAALWWIAYGALVLTSWREPTRHGDERRAWVPFACALTMYLTIPTRIGDASMLNVRLAPVITLFSLVGLRIGRHPLAETALGLAALATAVDAGSTVFEMRRVQREVAGDFDSVLVAMKPDTRVAMLNFENDSPRTFVPPYTFAGAYHVARGGAVASFSFAELPHWSVRYAPNRAPPAHVPFWAFDACAYRFREDGLFYDYVLVQGDVARFVKGAGISPRFEPVVRSGRFTLYEKRKDGPRPDDATPDRGPCSPPLEREH